MSSESEALGEWIAEQAAHIDAATHGLLTALREYDRSGNWYKQGFRRCADWLSWRVGWNSSTAREHLRVANRLAELPLIDNALRTGELSYSKARALTRVATPANEAALLEDARHATGSQLEVLCRKYATVVRASKQIDHAADDAQRTLIRTDREDGMVQIQATLHADEAAIVMAALERVARERCKTAADAAGATAGTADVDAKPAAARAAELHTSGATAVAADVDAERAAAAAARATRASALAADASCTAEASASPCITPSSSAALAAAAGKPPGVAPAPRHRFNRADALVEICEGIVRGESPDRSPTELIVTVAADTLRHPHTCQDPIAAIADGTCVSAEAARRLACDCGVVEMIVDDHGNPLSVGRKTRSIPTAIKRALLKRDKCCRFPGCTNRVYLEGHHTTHWADGGETSLQTLVLNCRYHHVFLHEYGYTVTLDDQQQPHYFDPQGREVVAAPEPAHPANLGWRAIAEANRALGITAETNACRWDGDRVNYGDAIDDLVRLDKIN